MRTIPETFTQFKVFQKSKHLQSFICFKKRISYLKTNYSVFRKMQTNFALEIENIKLGEELGWDYWG